MSIETAGRSETDGEGPEGVEAVRDRQLVETLTRVAQAVAQKHDLQDIVQLVTDEATALTGAQFGAFFYNVVRRDGEAYSLYTVSGAPLSKFERFPMPRATEIFQPTFEGTAIVRLDDVRQDPRYGRNRPYEGLPPGHLPVRSYLAVPVFAPEGEVVGGLFFGHEKPAVFTEDAERIAVGIAAQAGIAIERSRLLRAEREARAEAEAKGDAAVALEFVEDGVVMTDGDGTVRLWNRAAEAITGLDAQSVLGRPIGEALAGWERIALDVPIGGPTETVPPSTLPLDTLQGQEVWLSIYGVAFGEGTVYAFRDVTGQRNLEALRADVIATVSHELRTPIAAVYGAAQTLRKRKVPDSVASDLLAIIDSESERLTGLVDEILITSQIDRDQVQLARETVDPSETVTAVVGAVTARAGDASVDVEAPAGIPPVAADPDKLRQVIANLLENAIKYGASENGARVLVRVQDRRSGVRFEVVDYGPGIPRHEQSRIFEKFYRLDPHLKQGVRGTGLGLYISRELVHRMHGTIGVESSEGTGTTFWVELPRATGA